jgi:ComF family protein
MGELGRYPLQHLTRHINGLDGAFATGWHEGILQSAIQAFKYAQQRRLAQALAQRMADVLAHSRLAIDTLVPVPLHTLRLQNRGYNQAKELTIALAERVGYAFSGDAITRHRNTRPQVGLNQRERLANMQSAFTADAHHVQGKSLLLIDDVCTTGATLVGCANAAREAGAVAVYALTVTFAMG